VDQVQTVTVFVAPETRYAKALDGGFVAYQTTGAEQVDMSCFCLPRAAM
jgi:hypothetical protein